MLAQDAYVPVRLSVRSKINRNSETVAYATVSFFAYKTVQKTEAAFKKTASQFYYQLITTTS